MFSKKSVIICSLILVALIAGAWIGSNYKRDYLAIMATTGATPVAMAVSVNPGVTLKVDGLVKQKYELSGNALNALASARIRTHEVDSAGRVAGTYAYSGIPVLHILEGVAPEKPKTMAFNAPLDMAVVFTSADGKKSTLSYGEIIYVDDSKPVILAYDRKEIRATKDPEKYNKNIYKDNLAGLRLVCPRDSDTSRYLDDVVSITLSVPEIPDASLPAVKKGTNCESSKITCVWNDKNFSGSFSGIAITEKKGWFRTGHGRGFKSISTVKGYNLRSFLTKNFPGCGKKQYYLFVGCDGYRCLFSGKEIFDHRQGESAVIVNTLDSKKAPGGYMLAPLEDYFVDRDVWGLSYIFVLDRI